MKRSYLIVLCITILLVCAIICPCLPIFAKGSRERAQDVIGYQLKDSLVHNDQLGEVSSARDVHEALEMFDVNILPTLEDRSESRLRRLRSRISDGKSWTYQVVSGEWRKYYLIDLFPSSTSEGYGFPYLVSRWNDAIKTYDPPCENFGVLELLPPEDVSDGGIMLPKYEEYCRQLPRIKDVKLRTGMPYGCAEGCQIDVTAIVDVIDVELISISGCGFLNRHLNGLVQTSDSACAFYRVRLDVREVLNGRLPSDALILEARRMWHEFMREREWLYYRGMTLRIELQQKDDEILLVNELPVEPYPPYSNDCVCISGGALVGGVLANQLEGRLKPLVVEFRPHTKVEFCCGDVLVTGKHSSFADFGVTSKFRILELKEGAKRSYWENCWFASGLYGRHAEWEISGEGMSKCEQ